MGRKSLLNLYMPEPTVGEQDSRFKDDPRTPGTPRTLYMRARVNEDPLSEDSLDPEERERILQHRAAMEQRAAMEAKKVEMEHRAAMEKEAAMEAKKVEMEHRAAMEH